MPLLLAVVIVAVYLVAEIWFLDGELGFPLDDPWIHMQFARNLAQGDGLSYNPGQLVPGSTAPLWTALLSLLFLLPGSPVLWAKLLGATCFVAAVDVTRRLARELGLDERLSVFASAMTAVTGWLVWSALSGMEIPLFILLSLWGILLQVRERRDERRAPMSMFLFGTAVLARPEGLLLLALAAVDRLVVPARNRDGDLTLRWPSAGPTVWGALAAAIVVVPVALFNKALSGSVLPTTFSAKSTGVTEVVPNVQALYKISSVFFSTQPYFTFTAIAGCLILLERWARRDDESLLPALWLVGLPLAYSTLGGVQTTVLAGNFGRYYFPLLPLLSVLGVIGLAPAFAALGRRLEIRGLRLPLALFSLLLVAWPTFSGAYRGLGRYLQSVSDVHGSDVRIARWLETRLDPDAVLAVNDVGAIKYLLPNRVIDMAGIINPELNRYMQDARSGGKDWHEGVLRLLEETRPDYLVIFPGWFPRLTELDPRYVTEYVLDIPGNITMGGNRIAVYRTPWTRFPLAERMGGDEEVR
jgi:hypothetical protein